VKYDQGLVFHVITLAPLSAAFVPGSKTHGIPADHVDAVRAMSSIEE